MICELYQFFRSGARGCGLLGLLWLPLMGLPVQAALQDPSKNIAADLRRAQQMITSDEAQAALKIVQNIVAQQPKNTQALFLLGEAYFALKQWAQAIKYFEQGLALAPKYRAQAFNLARSYQKVQNYEPAENIYLQMIQEESTYVAAKGYFGMGLLSEDRGNIKLAMQWYQGAVKKDPSNHRALYKLALEDLQRGRTEQSRERFQQVLQLRPLHHGAAYNLSLAYRRQGQLDLSKKAYNRWQNIRNGKQRLKVLHAQLRAGSAQSLAEKLRSMTAIADQYLELREWTLSYQWYRRCLSIRPGDAVLMLGLATTLVELKKDSFARQIYHELLGRKPPVLAAVEPLILLLKRVGDLEQAAAIRKKFPQAK